MWSSAVLWSGARVRKKTCRRCQFPFPIKAVGAISDISSNIQCNIYSVKKTWMLVNGVVGVLVITHDWNESSPGLQCPGVYFLVKDYWGCAAGWGRIFTTGLTIMGLHF